MTIFPLLFSLARSFFAPRLELIAEVLALRQQLAILNRTAKRPSLRFQDRLFWIALAKIWQGWRSALLIVKPETVINGIAKGFSFIGVGNRKQVAQDVQESLPKFAHLFAGSHERIRCGARHGFKPNSIYSGSRWLNQPSPNTGSNRFSLLPKLGRLSSPIMPGKLSVLIFSSFPPPPSVTFTASSSFCMRDVELFTSM